jgi:hypothetical protein
MPRAKTTLPPSAEGFAPPTADARSLGDVLAQAHAMGVELEAYQAGDEICVLHIHRPAHSPKGRGRLALQSLQGYAAGRGLPISLDFWAYNDALRSYYADLGFAVVCEPDDPDSDDDHATARWLPAQTPRQTDLSTEERR